MRGIAPNDDFGIATTTSDGTVANIFPGNVNGIAYSRSTGQVLNIVYLTGAGDGGRVLPPTASTARSRPARRRPEGHAPSHAPCFSSLKRDTTMIKDSIFAALEAANARRAERRRFL
ncbi:hypothetical protein AB5I41_20665 [Sphingomonas sp. MMS24-JH45]